MPQKPALSISEILIRGSEILERHPRFGLVGRDQELIELSSILMKMRKRNLLVLGRGGVGISSIILGIQASKSDSKTPIDIVAKRLYWLNTDRLFETGNTQVINDLFVRIRQTLSKTTESILVLEDTSDFIRAAHNNGCTNLINGLFGDLKSGKYQAILEAKDDNLAEILKCDGDVQEFCTLYEVKEPSAENLRLILNEAVKELERHHGIKISPAALECAASLTDKYKLVELRAQPDAAVSLLDRSLTDYCREAHSAPQQIEQLKRKLKDVESALGGGNVVAEHRTASAAELTAIKQRIEKETASLQAEWDARQKEVRNLYRDMSDGEEEVRRLEDQIEQIRTSQFNQAQQVEHSQTGATEPTTDNKKLGAFTAIMAQGNLDTPEISELKTRIKKLEDIVKDLKGNYKSKVQEIYKGLLLDEHHVLETFSILSGVPVDKLNEDERVKLRNLEQVLSRRVIGQEEPVTEVAKAVRRARVGLKMPNKPAGTFMFLGPSGVGKTELAKSLAEALGVPLLRFDMSEYMEKHAVAKLIGAPPGYEGYEHGGILTNAARKNPYSVVLFDEIEKAHGDVFNLMLQLLDDARLTDSRGLTASFKDTIVIMTTNIGTTHFLDEGVTFADAKEQALTDLRQQYKPEFLGRFGGNIYCFQRLELKVLQAIGRKDLERINRLITNQEIQISMADSDLVSMISDRYIPREGARSILGYIDRNITSGIADLVLAENPIKGVVNVRYDTKSKAIAFEPLTTH